MDVNMKMMKAQWTPYLLFPIEGLFKQLEEGRDFAAEANIVISESLLVMYGYDSILATGQFTKYGAKWRGCKQAVKTCKDFCTTFTKYDKDRSDSMTVKEGHYTMNQVQELIQQGVQKEMAQYSMQVQDENSNPNLLPPLIQ